MSKEMVISSNRHETKVALLEEDQLCELYFQRSNEYSLAGSIHKGRVTRVLPGMQSAFVDVGLERDTFLYVSDFLEEHDDIDKVTGDERAPRGRDGGRDRDRGRGRDDRDRRGPQRDAPQQVAQPPSDASTQSAGPLEEAATAAEGEASTETPPTDESAPVPAASPSAALTDASGDRRDRGERRGRRTRRHKRGGRGFPDSKYAGDQTHVRSEQASDAARTAVLDRSAADSGQKETPLPSAMESVEVAAPILLPGESLAKYSRASALPPPAVDALPAGADIEEIESEESEYNQPTHYPPENALPDAPMHEVQGTQEFNQGAESVASSVSLPEVLPEMIPEIADAVDSSAIPEEDAEIPTADNADYDGENPVNDFPPVTSLLDEDEDHDIQAMILGDVEGIEIDPSEEPAAAAAAESGTAEVREQGGRYPHRMQRRGRRRGGRGGEPRDSRELPRGPEAAGAATVEANADTRSGPRPDAPADAPRDTRNVSRPNVQQPSISDLLKEGQEIIVQIAKEPLGQKGARITSHIALPGRYVVYMPTLEHTGVSRKIASDDERLRLKRILQAKRPGTVGGFITRTAAEGRTEDEIAGDMQFLYDLWQDIKTRADKRRAPMLLHHDLDIVQRILRDQLTDTFKAVWIDNEEMYENVVRFVERFQPSLTGKVKLYTREAPIFDAFNITSELEKALRPKVWLKSGGFIVINQTEALVAIDVNTGKYVGKTNRLEDTIVKTNTEAIKEIVRQIRLRDLGGIIVIDFIDMDERKNRQKVMQALEEAMRADRAPYKILQFNDFGLVAITRKRVKQSLERTLCAPCPHCEGAGYIKSVQTVVGELLTEARKIAKSIDGKDVMLRVHPDVAKVLKSHENKYLEELEELLRRPVIVKSDPQLHHEKFDLA